MSVRLRIIAAMKQIAEEQQVKLPPLNDELSLHETGFDSLAFAILVARLEDDLGIDPFTISEDAAFPLTVGAFVRAYEQRPVAAPAELVPAARGPIGHVLIFADIARLDHRAALSASLVDGALEGDRAVHVVARG